MSLTAPPRPAARMPRGGIPFPFVLPGAGIDVASPSATAEFRDDPRCVTLDDQGLHSSSFGSGCERARHPQRTTHPGWVGRTAGLLSSIASPDNSNAPSPIPPRTPSDGGPNTPLTGCRPHVADVHGELAAALDEFLGTVPRIGRKKPNPPVARAPRGVSSATTARPARAAIRPGSLLGSSSASSPANGRLQRGYRSRPIVAHHTRPPPGHSDKLAMRKSVALTLKSVDAPPD